MIAPRVKFAAAGTAVILPLSVLAGIFADARPICVLGIVIFGLVAMLDLLVGQGRYRSIAVEPAPVIRAVAGRIFEYLIKLDLTGLPKGRMRLAIDLPRPIQCDHPIVTVDLDGKTSDTTVLLKAKAHQRGIYSITKLYFDWRSPLGFWVYRQERPLRTELRVYPDLALEGREIAHFLNRGGFGVHRQRQIGRGREFEKLREYEPGDSFDSIHWKAAAKRHKPVTKVFQVEKSQEVYLAIDASRLTARSAAAIEPSRAVASTVLERSIAAALLAGAAAERQGDLFGIITFTDRVDQLARARSGTLHFNHCRDLLVGLYPKLVAPDFEDIASTLLNRLTKRSLLIFLTALDDAVTGENFLAGARFLARRHLVMAMMLLPPGTQPLFTPPGVKETTEIYDRLAGHLRWAKLQELRRQLLQAGVLFHLAPDQSFTLAVINEYLAIKHRQLL